MCINVYIYIYIYISLFISDFYIHILYMIYVFICLFAPVLLFLTAMPSTDPTPILARLEAGEATDAGIA